jgi:hypothetical protein
MSLMPRRAERGLEQTNAAHRLDDIFVPPDHLAVTFSVGLFVDCGLFANAVTSPQAQ